MIYYWLNLTDEYNIVPYKDEIELFALVDSIVDQEDITNIECEKYFKQLQDLPVGLIQIINGKKIVKIQG